MEYKNLLSFIRGLFSGEDKEHRIADEFLTEIKNTDIDITGRLEKRTGYTYFNDIINNNSITSVNNLPVVIEGPEGYPPGFNKKIQGIYNYTDVGGKRYVFVVVDGKVYIETINDDNDKIWTLLNPIGDIDLENRTDKIDIVSYLDIVFFNDYKKNIYMYDAYAYSSDNYVVAGNRYIYFSEDKIYFRNASTFYPEYHLNEINDISQTNHRFDIDGDVSFNFEVGDYIYISGCTDSDNDGQYAVTAVDYNVTTAGKTTVTIDNAEHDFNSNEASSPGTVQSNYRIKIENNSANAEGYIVYQSLVDISFAAVGSLKLAYAQRIGNDVTGYNFYVLHDQWGTTGSKVYLIKFNDRFIAQDYIEFSTDGTSEHISNFTYNNNKIYLWTKDGEVNVISLSDFSSTTITEDFEFLSKPSGGVRTLASNDNGLFAIVDEPVNNNIIKELVKGEVNTVADTTNLERILYDSDSNHIFALEKFYAGTSAFSGISKFDLSLNYVTGDVGAIIYNDYEFPFGCITLQPASPSFIWYITRREKVEDGALGLYKVNASTIARTQYFPFNDQSIIVDLIYHSGYLYAADIGLSQVHKIDVSSGAITESFYLSDSETALNLNPLKLTADGDYVFAATAYGMFQITISTSTVSDRITTFYSPTAMQVVNSKVYISAKLVEDDDSYYIIKTSTSGIIEDNVTIENYVNYFTVNSNDLVCTLNHEIIVYTTTTGAIKRWSTNNDNVPLTCTILQGGNLFTSHFTGNFLSKMSNTVSTSNNYLVHTDFDGKTIAEKGNGFGAPWRYSYILSANTKTYLPLRSWNNILYPGYLNNATTYDGYFFEFNTETIRIAYLNSAFYSNFSILKETDIFFAISHNSSVAVAGRFLPTWQWQNGFEQFRFGFFNQFIDFYSDQELFTQNMLFHVYKTVTENTDNELDKIQRLGTPKAPFVRIDSDSGSTFEAGTLLKYFMVYKMTSGKTTALSPPSDIIEIPDLGGGDPQPLNITLTGLNLQNRSGVNIYAQDDVEFIQIYRSKKESGDTFFSDPTLLGSLEWDGSGWKNASFDYETFEDNTQDLNINPFSNNDIFTYPVSSILVHKNRLILVNRIDIDNPNVIQYSDIDVANAIPEDNIRPIESGDGDILTAGISTGDYLYLFKRSKIYAILGDVFDGQLIDISKTIGCQYKNMITEYNGVIYFLNNDSIYRVINNSITDVMNHRIKDFFDSQNINYIDFDNISDEGFASVDVDNKEIRFFVPYKYFISVNDRNQFRTGTDGNLQNPANYDQDGQFLPAVDTASKAYIMFHDADDIDPDSAKEKWLFNTYNPGINAEMTYDSGTGGYGSLAFSPTKDLLGDLYVWEQFASASFNGKQKLWFPGTEDDDRLGGYVEYDYNYDAMYYAFYNTSSKIVFGKDGSIYKGSISADNLVRASNGFTGPAGGGNVGLVTAQNKLCCIIYNTEFDYFKVYEYTDKFTSEIKINDVLTNEYKTVLTDENGAIFELTKDNSDNGQNIIYSIKTKEFNLNTDSIKKIFRILKIVGIYLNNISVTYYVDGKPKTAGKISQLNTGISNKKDNVIVKLWSEGRTDNMVIKISGSDTEKPFQIDELLIGYERLRGLF